MAGAGGDALDVGGVGEHGDYEVVVFACGGA